MSVSDRLWNEKEERRSRDERQTGENFPVASRLLPARHRAHLLNVYGYARIVDDIGDEAPRDERTALLDLVERDLDRIYAGEEPGLPAMRNLATTVTDLDIPAEPFRRLLRANRQDQEVSRYETFDDLLAYCTLSADPVGHIVLHVFGAATPDRLPLSDKVCTALQIIEHCQDVGEDHRNGRIYLPQDDLRRFGCVESDLDRSVTPTRLRGVVALQAARAREMLAEGAGLAPRLHGFARVAVAGYVAGGLAALAALDRDAYDVLGRTSRPKKTRLFVEWSRTMGVSQTRWARTDQAPARTLRTKGTALRRR
ncbi:squalene synthase HpnC [Actinomadura pelletieri DSM 43383]|uniref:Squalene synthase HpnC n=1 Tax=Actinomadura pelletieri DSM 43383 TaxID=1120940 RepID=A0A495QSZ0_9ACTN|nr:squalene synthase HpnC [Actinomadura pelletieri]RKS76615.1 squalene synthase HpnC [Actinomadura pelletieri DSM 43383]